MRLPHGYSVVAQRGRQVFHGQRVLAVFVGLGIRLGAMTGAGRITGASLAVLQRIVRHVRDELLRGNRD